MNGSLKVAGMIVAGGQSRRFDYHDKSWAEYGNKSLIEHVIERASDQVEVLSISSNSQNLSKFEQFRLPLLEDDEFPNQGPMSGVLRGLQWASSLGFQWLVSFPVDTPNIPQHLVEALLEKMQETSHQRVVASDGEHEQSILGLWSVSLIEVIRQGLARGDNKISLCVQVPYSKVSFDTLFLNINSPTLLEQANAEPK